MLTPEDLNKLADAWSEHGCGLKAHKYMPETNLAKLFSLTNYTQDFGPESELKYPNIDVKSIFKNNKLEPYLLGAHIKREDIFPLKEVEFLGVPGVMVPNNMETILTANYRKAFFLDEDLLMCRSPLRDHRRVSSFPGPSFSVPCKELEEFLRLKSVLTPSEEEQQNNTKK